MKTDPTDPTALDLLARSVMERDPEVAWRSASAAVGAAPNNPWFLTTASFAASASRRRTEALKLAREAVRIAPDSATSQHTLATMLSLAGSGKRDLSEAHHAAKEAIRLAPNDPDGWLVLGVVQHRSGNEQSARAAYLEALRIDPDQDMAKQNLALLDIDAGDYGSAVELLVGVAALDPGNERARSVLAETFSDFLGHLLWASAIAMFVLIALLQILTGQAGGG